MTEKRKSGRPSAVSDGQGALPDPPIADPGGAHSKGYTAEVGPLPHVGDGPVPLAAVPDPPPPIHVPERDNHVTPTGRSEPGEYTPNDRLIGADR